MSARKLIDCIESDKPNFAKEYWVDKVINEAMFVLEKIKKIDKKWPEGAHRAVSFDRGLLRRLDKKIASASKPATNRNALLGSGTGVPCGPCSEP